MSLKLVEMQIALPRTQDAGKLQEQLQQRGQSMGDFAAQAEKKDADQKRKAVNKQEQKSNIQFQKEQPGGGGKHSRQEKRGREAEEQTAKECHPYKGKAVDYSG